MKLASVAVVFSAISSALAHGYVTSVLAGGTNYTGYMPYQDPYTTPTPQRIIRKVPGNGPVTDLSLIDVQCNGYTEGGAAGSAPAALVAAAAAGSQIKLKWTMDWPASHVEISFPYYCVIRSTPSPMITYMAKAPSDITKWSPGTSAVWFKVHEIGKDSSGKWAATDILTQNGYVYTFTIPASLKAGQYLIRHEIIALHAAYSYPGAQVYPSCIQINVTGSGTKSPTSFVSFPGAYTASTPGIVFDAYQGTATYPIPGPTVWTG